MPKQAKSFEDMMEETSRMMFKHEAMKKKIQATQIVIESVEENGETVTLQTLISLSAMSEDDKVDEMLLLFPGMVELNKFLKKIPSFEVDAETFERLIKDGRHFV
jgi:hypothetical protein